MTKIRIRIEVWEVGKNETAEACETESVLTEGFISGSEEVKEAFNNTLAGLGYDDRKDKV